VGPAGAPLQTKVARLDAVLSRHAEDLQRGEFVVATPGLIRVADRPAS
jgi:hypothetical protein